MEVRYSYVAKLVEFTPPTPTPTTNKTQKWIGKYGYTDGKLSSMFCYALYKIYAFGGVLVLPDTQKGGKKSHFGLFVLSFSYSTELGHFYATKSVPIYQLLIFGPFLYF